MTDILHGLKVVDFSMGVAGPYAASLCHQYGAEVTKIEPSGGEWGRRLGKTHGDLSAYFTVFNRGKKSIVLDLKSPDGHNIAKQLVAEADIVIESFRPKVMESLKLSYEAVKAINPDVIYLSVSGFGQEGTRSRFPATDSIAQGYSGFINLNRDSEGRPFKTDMIVMDVVTGLYGFQSVMAALIGRLRNVQEGAYIDCNLLQSGIAFQAPKIAEFQIEGGMQALYVPLGVFETADGLINISVNQNDDFEKFCAAVERPELYSDERFITRDKRVENAKELLEITRNELRKLKTEVWQERFLRLDLRHSPVWTYNDLLNDDEVKRLGWIEWVSQSGIPGLFPVVRVPGIPPSERNIATGAPHVDEHRDEILRRLGV